MPKRAASRGGARRGGAAKTLTRIALGSFLTFAGVSHLTFARKEFRAQVPPWIPVDEDLTVLGSGIAEITLGVALASGWKKKSVGRAVAAFFVAVFPGNISQWRHHRDGFGLDTDRKRLLRLPLQIPLIAGALWSTSPRKRATK